MLAKEIHCVSLSWHAKQQCSKRELHKPTPSNGKAKKSRREKREKARDLDLLDYGNLQSAKCRRQGYLNNLPKAPRFAQISLSFMILASFSCNIIQDTLCFMRRTDREGDFHALAMEILAASSIKLNIL